MKKFLSVLMVLIMVLSLSITAFAAEEKGSITIANPTMGKTYKLYKLFDASVGGNKVAYTIDKEEQFFSALFNSDGTAAAENTFFTYNPGNKQVTKVDGVNETALLNYVKNIVQVGTYTATQTIEATTANLEDGKIVFKNVPCGYYIIDVVGVPGAAKGMITVTTNTPDAVVVDKNQLPFANGIHKEVRSVLKTENDVVTETSEWTDLNTAFVGDVVNYRVSFNATNYAGMEQIRYYTIHDEKGNALWVEFGNDTMNAYDIVVKVGDQTLKKGYYHLANKEIETDVQEWEYLGEWTEAEKAAQKANGNVAEWYLVHYGYDEFEIVIPWVNSYRYKAPTVDPATNEKSTYAFELEFDDTVTSKFDSNEYVEVMYYASVEPNANIGKTDNLKNSAYVKWTGKNTSKVSETVTVYTRVDGIGIHKKDTENNNALPGAEFEVYMDEGCTVPLYVIPTDIEGVYVFDDRDAPGQQISGDNMETAIKKYACIMKSNAQTNKVVTPKNGKIVITGLKDGTYYIKEVKAPDGYNCLSDAIAVTAGNTSNRFYIYASDPSHKNPHDNTLCTMGKVDDIQGATVTYKQHEYIVTVAEVFNTPGTVLPSTGGEGTAWMITIGSLMAIGFAVFLITHKKMSVYTD